MVKWASLSQLLKLQISVNYFEKNCDIIILSQFLLLNRILFNSGCTVIIHRFDLYREEKKEGDNAEDAL